MGRPKKVRINGDKEAPEAEVCKKKGVREDDGFAFICALCDDFGELLCCERCRDGFHLSCLGLGECPDVDPWLCSNCSDNKVRCFKCKSFGSLELDLVRCAHRNCGKYYHKDCSTEWNRIPSKKMSSTVALVCPRHHCDTCRQFQKNAKLYRCLHCPVAYHESCSPEGTNLLEDIPGYLLCWKHDDEWKNDHKDAEPIRDLKISLERLPLPNIAHDFQLPRVIFDTVRRMQKKHPLYYHIRRNIYLVKRSRRSQRDEKMECLCKPTAGAKETCSKDCLCGMLFTSCSSSCGCGDLCTNLPFQKLPGCKLKAVKTERCGMGLVADEDIKAGSFLIETIFLPFLSTCGDERSAQINARVIDDKTCEERLWVMKKQGEVNFYMCEISREMVIDATFKGNLSRYINHSCHPNSELQKWDIDGETRIGVFAMYDINRGDPVTYDYKFIQFGTDQYCHCGAPDCRGQLGKPMKPRKTGEEAVDTTLTGCPLPQTLKKSNLCGNFSLKHVPCEHRHQRRKSTSHDSNGDAGTQALQSEQSRGAKLVGLRIKIWWPLDQKQALQSRVIGPQILGLQKWCMNLDFKHFICRSQSLLVTPFYHGKVLGFDGSTGKHQICYDDGEIEALCLFKELWEVGDVDKYKRRTRRGFPSTLDPPFDLNGASEKAVNSSFGAAASEDDPGKAE